MLLFPNCKINIGLDILRLRDDGYRDIETVMYPVPGLCDGLEIVRSDAGEGVKLTTSGIAVDCLPEKNLAVKAYEAMRSKYGIGGILMHLHKAIPFGSGLGGGSADAAFAIKGLNELFELGLSSAEMENVAAELGSDVPFFIRNTPRLCAGRGEVMEDIGVDLRGMWLAVIVPDIHVSTAEAYAAAPLSVPDIPLRKRVLDSVDKWRENVGNAFEKALFPKYHELELLKTSFYEAGAIYASMTGSGSGCFGIFTNRPSCLSMNYANRFIIQL